MKSVGMEGGYLSFKRTSKAVVGASLMLALLLPGSSAAVERPVEVQLPELGSPIANFLAGRVARSTHDSSAAAYYLRRAVDDANQDAVVRDEAFESLLLNGNISEAYVLAADIIEDGEDKTGFAGLVLSVAAIQAGDYEAAVAHLDGIKPGTISHLPRDLLMGWMLYALQGADTATSYLQAERSAAYFGPYHDFHAALIRDMDGDPAASEISYLLVLSERRRQLPRVVEGYGRHLARTDQVQDAIALYQDFQERFAGHPIMDAVFNDIASGHTPELLVNTVQEGVAESLYGIAELVLANRLLDVAQILLNIAVELRPDYLAAQTRLATLLETEGRYVQANEIYGRIQKGTVLYNTAQRGIAHNLTMVEQHDAAFGILDGMLRENSTDAKVLSLYGDILRAQDRFDDAIPYYDRAVKSLGKPEARDWRLYYVRGIAYERIGEWKAAERSFLKALELNPDQPSVLNYLGYTWVEQGGRLGEATAYIQRAVRIRPNDGYFIDSLGWAQFRAGEYDDAVRSLERAIHLTPQDAVINDHLGDAYWHVGRKLEARFQWRHSLSLDPEEDQLEILRQKLKHGL